MNVSVNPHWRALKARLIRDLGYEGAETFLRFASHSVRCLGEEGAAEHFAFAAEQMRLEGERHAAA